MQLGVVVLPVLRWPDARETWRELEDAGFDSAWTYDHVEWHGWRDRAWYAAYPLLAAVAASTARIRIGTLVTSTNIRHPVTLAQDVLTLDELSGGRFDLGIGAGGRGPDASVLGNEPWTPRERVDRFGELVELVDLLLTHDRTTWTGRYYAADEAPMFAGSVQRPRVPFTIAADGPRSMRIAVQFGDRWVANVSHGELDSKVELLERTCAVMGRDPASLGRTLLVDEPTSTFDSFDSLRAEIERGERLGFDHVVVRHPLGGDRTVFDELCRALPDLRQ